MKSHLTRGIELSMEELLLKAKSHERWRNVVALYSLRSAEHFYVLLRQSNYDSDVRQILFDLHAALSIPEDPRLRSLARMLRHLPFYEKTGQSLDRLQLPITTASRQISKLLRSLDRLHRLRGRKISDEKSRYVAERRSSVKLIK
ncbi:hypothetical protein [Ammoniphilus sp. 3BR4]|uniref:hypothetical protein n=1 Tax=Ammoniphilus sp. 3BR4 TaxID=3158265 RepID=UPI00346761E7